MTKLELKNLHQATCQLLAQANLELRHAIINQLAKHPALKIPYKFWRKIPYDTLDDFVEIDSGSKYAENKNNPNKCNQTEIVVYIRMDDNECITFANKIKIHFISVTLCVDDDPNLGRIRIAYKNDMNTLYTYTGESLEDVLAMIAKKEKLDYEKQA